MNALLYFGSEKCSPNKVVIRADRAADVLQRHNLRPGLTIRLVEYQGYLGRGTVVSCSRSQIEIEIEQLDDTKLSRSPTVLIVAIARPQTVKKLIHLGTTLGVKSIFLVASARSEKSYFQSRVLSDSTVLREVVLGLEQAVDTDPPEIKIYPRFDRFVTEVLSQSNSANLLLPQVRLVADTQAEESCSIAQISLVDSEQPVLLAVGPEAGWDIDELRLFGSLGFSAVSLGKRMLRVETAAAVLLSQIQLLREQTRFKNKA